MDLQQLSIDLQWKKASDEVMDLWEKAAIDPSEPSKRLLERLGEFINLWPGEYPGGVPNHPGTLQSMLVGGLAGGALGYGTGLLAEHLMPDTWKKERTRRTGAILGALAGISPGLIQGGMSAGVGGSFWQPEIFQDRKQAEDARDSIRESFIKTSRYGFGYSPVSVQQFNDTVWNDPRVADRLSLPMQAAASGLVMGAARLPGKRQGTKLITPMDMGRMAAGMGSGYLSGALVGKGLGLLFGMPESTQERLKETGMFAGVISNLVPVAFGG
jgi:hypothetical protein